MIVGKEVYSLKHVSKRVQRSVLYSACTLLSVMGLVLYGAYGTGPVTPTVHTAQAADTLNIWWPSSGSHIEGLQPFKAMVEGTPVEQYDMYWQVDGGSLNPMNNSYIDYPHKEASVNVSGWNWHSNNQYTITFVAKKSGTIISQRSIIVYVDNGSVSNVNLVMGANIPAPTPSPSPVSVPLVPTVSPATAPQTSTLATAPNSSASINVWWPTANANLSGTQPFKAEVKNMSVDVYDIYWQVDNGTLVLMPNSSTDSPHKEVSVNVSNWTWHGSGPYTVTFVAKDKGGSTIGTVSEQVTVNSSSGSIAAPTPAPITQTVQAQTTTVFSAPVVSFSASTGNLLGGVSLYVNQNSSAKNQADQWSSSRPSDAQAMRILASAPTATWFGNWNSNIYNDVQSLVKNASAQGQAPVMVAYNIPGRDCSGGYSSGGSSSADAYRSWIGSMASAIGSNKAVVVLEPDSLADLNCLSSGDQQTRLTLLADAITILKRNSNTAVYLDAGHSGWVSPSTMASNLRSAGVGAANGFAVNVSNFDAMAVDTGYGDQISQALGGAHYVIDTSRNGTGSNGQWCNPQGRAIGTKPSTATGHSNIDAFLWLKTPGESDGYCNGGPGAGQWWADYALQLVRNSGQ